KFLDLSLSLLQPVRHPQLGVHHRGGREIFAGVAGLPAGAPVACALRVLLGAASQALPRAESERQRISLTNGEGAPAEQALVSEPKITKQFLLWPSGVAPDSTDFAEQSQFRGDHRPVEIQAASTGCAALWAGCFGKRPRGANRI